MSGSCGWFPLRHQEIEAWVARHSEELPRTLPELSRLPIPFRKAIVAALPADARVALWAEHLAGFLEPEAGLSSEQQDLVRDALAELPAIFGSSVETGRGQALRLEERMRTVITQPQAHMIFGTLGPPEPPEGLPLPPDALPRTDIGLRLMTADDLPAAAHLLAEAFRRDEPMAMAARQHSIEIAQLALLIGAKAVQEHLAFVAHDPAGEMVGAALVHDFGAPPPEGLSRIGPTSRPIVALLDNLEHTYETLHEIEPGAHAHIFMIAVTPTAAGRGVAGRLVGAVLANARERGYRFAFTEATSAGSQRVFRRAGFRELAATRYDTFELEGERPFATIDTPESALLMEREL